MAGRKQVLAVRLSKMRSHPSRAVRRPIQPVTAQPPSADNTMSYPTRHQLPGPRAMPLLGGRANLIPFMRNPIRYMNRLHRRYGEIVSLARGTTNYVFIFAPEYNQQVLGNTSLFFNLDANSSPLRIPPNSSLARLFAGLSQMNGARHKQQRQLMMPALQRKRIESYYKDIVPTVERKLSGWRSGQRRELYQEMRGLTLAVAIKAFLGLDLSGGGAEVCRLLDRWLSLVFSLSVMVLPLNLPGFPYHRLLALSEELEAVIRRLIERKRGGGPNATDVLSTLMQTHDEDNHWLTDDELIGQINFLFMAGHATTASALTWTLFLLAQHPAAMAAVLRENQEQLRGETPALEQLEQLVYLEAVIKETMRLVPPVLWWGRVSTEPFKLGPYELPAGVFVIHSAYITHRLASHYPESDRFLPERWLKISPGPYQYLPFSAGPRMCLGSTFAMIEMKLVLSMLLQRFRLSLPAKTRVDLSGIMLSAPRGGLPVLVHQQDFKTSRSEIHGNIEGLINLN